FGQRPGVRERVFAPHLVVEEMESAVRLLLGLGIQRPLELPALVGSCQAHADLPPLGSSGRTPNQGSFPPPGLPGFFGTPSLADPPSWAPFPRASTVRLPSPPPG